MLSLTSPPRSLQINGVDNSVRLWDMRTLRPVSELVDHTEHEPRNQVRPEDSFDSFGSRNPGPAQ